MGGSLYMIFVILVALPVIGRVGLGIPLKATYQAYWEVLSGLVTTLRLITKVLTVWAVAAHAPVERRRRVRVAYPIHQDYRTGIARSAGRACLRCLLGRPRPYYYRVRPRQIRRAERRLGMNEGWTQ